MRQVLRWYWPFWQERRYAMLLVIIVTAAAIAVKTIYPYTFKYIIDTLTVGADLHDVRAWVLILLGVGIAREFTQWLLPCLRYIQNMFIGQAIRLRFFDLIIHKDFTFFNAYRSGDLITRLTDDIDTEDKIAWYGCSGVMRPVEASLTLVFSIALMMSLNWQLTIIAMLPLPIIIWVITTTEHMQERAYKHRQKMISTTNDVLESAFSGIRIVIGYAAEKAQSQLYATAMKERVKAEEKVVFVRSLLEALGGVINQFGLVLVLFVGGYFVLQRKISLGDFYAFIAYLSGMTETIWTLSWFMVSTKLTEASVMRMADMERTGARFDTGICYQPIAKNHDQPCLRLHQLRYRYAADKKSVLNDLTFAVQPREVIALVGAVGSGKSTVLNVAAGLFPPLSGDIGFNGNGSNPAIPTHVDPRAGNNVTQKRALQIGFVPQEIILFSGTVGENVSMERPGIGAEQIAQALAAAVASAELSADKAIEQGGTGLSGGQKARVALARAIAHKPSLLLMDDVTAALDAATETELWNRLRAYLPEAAILVATHREATARIANRVVWLKDGAIFAEGTHQELLHDHHDYQRLFAKK